MSYRELLWVETEEYVDGDSEDYFRNILCKTGHFPAPQKIAFCLLSVPSEPSNEPIIDRGITNAVEDLKIYLTGKARIEHMPARIYLGELEGWNNYTDLYDIEQPVELLQAIVNCCARKPISMADDYLNTVLRQHVRNMALDPNTIELINKKLASENAPSVVNLIVISEQCYENIKQSRVRMPKMVCGIFRYTYISSFEEHILEVFKANPELYHYVEKYTKDILLPSLYNNQGYDKAEDHFKTK